MWQFFFWTIICTAVSVDAFCLPFSYGDWESWLSCSEPCGGGTRKRVRYSCVLSQEDWQTEDCNQICYHGGSFDGGSCHCSNWRDGSCCADCSHIYIDNCKSGLQECGGSPDGIRCTDCEDPFYSAGFGEGCAGMCARNNHYCWPGECSNKLTTSCECADGFREVRSSSETSCQLEDTNTPAIETCETKVMGANGELKRAASRTHLSTCDSLADFYGNFQPKYLMYDVMANFKVDIAMMAEPDFISESNFGITDATLILNIQPVQGSFQTLKNYDILVDTTNSIKATQTFSNKGNETLPSHAQTLADGKWLCITYEAKGGGYLKSFDLQQTHAVPSNPVPYTKTSTIKKLCYRYDSASPEHCGAIGKCTYDPLQISARITRSDITSVTLKGWTDPFPFGGNSSHASGIETYEITLHEVIASTDVLKVNTNRLYSSTVKSPTNPIDLNLTSNSPKLYAIYLEVKDVADNIKQSRRFVLYDNSSKIETNPNRPFFVESASLATNNTWQTHHHDICLNWTKHFYNRFYLENPLLSRVEPDPSGLIQGIYEQNTGILPVSGTPNVDGIINFMFSWSLNSGGISSELIVPHFLRQHYCHSFNLNDGETYILNIRATDIANNSLAENKTVHIDRSFPHINNIWLVKNGVHGLFVHDRTDLSEMNLSFEALDPHSGIREIQWAFGTSDSGAELLTGNIAINITEQKCHYNSSQDYKCYCPDVGKCEFYSYTLPMKKLVAADKHIGDHNRNYFFTIKVTNHARLSNIDHLDILVDDSPPETGVIFEGPENGPDIDYTSDDSFIVHWHGFIDHESGIRLYKLALSNRCLNKDEMSNSTFEHVEIPYTETSTGLPANFTGKMFTTIVAVNNALDISEPVCSDGITRDISAPRITNITVQNGKWSESLICFNGWLLNSDMRKVQLHDTSGCSRCKNFTNTDMFPATVPAIDMENLDDDLSDSICDSLPFFIQDTVIIYLPDDHIYLNWDINDAGSQINDFSVGIGLVPSEVSSPSQMKYISTGKKTIFNKHHVGIGSSELFYIFLKAENKAGLVRILTIGPVLIDETPPLSRSAPEVKAVDPNIVVIWTNDTFFDMEQSELIDQIYFQFGHDRLSVTPLMEWRYGESTECPGHDGMCIKYPIKKLQKYDTKFGFDFYISLFVYNKAGHFLRIDTETFRIPSSYPPGNAVVLDVDPQDAEEDADVNIHFTESRLCAKWNGFRHHENITLEFAVGLGTHTDDVIPFHQIDNYRVNCINSSKLLPGTKYHAIIRSTCSGGQTVSASNGVTIMTQAYINSFLKVHVGKQCRSSQHIARVLFDDKHGKTILRVNRSLEIGKSYHIYVPENVSVWIEQGHGKLKLIQDQDTASYYDLFPFVHRPELSIMVQSNSVEAERIKIVRCSNSLYIPVDNTFVETFWYFTTGKIFPITFDTGFLEHGLKTNKFLEGTVSSYQRSNIVVSKLPRPHHVEPELSYSIAVRPCIKRRCLEPVLSSNFTFILEPPTGKVSVADIKFEEGRSCFTFDLQWDSFRSRSPVTFYQWTLSEDKAATRTVTEWSTIDRIAIFQYKVSECLTIPHDLHRTLFACVRAYAEGEQSVTTCKKLRKTSRGAYNTNLVYDIDATKNVWSDIKAAITSSDLGEIYRLLHDSELDFATTSARFAGVVVYGTERTIEWFLMTQPQLPTLCQDSVGCLQYQTSHTGFIEFDAKHIEANTKYYICVASNVTHVERELFSERLEELRTCSDGFVLDDTPPFAGEIHVTHNKGYLTDTSHIVLSFDGFRDNIDATKLDYVDSIQSYSYAVGRRSGGDDIVGFSDVGSSKVVAINLTGISDGTTVYFTVRVVDQAGLSTNVTSQELTVDTSPPSIGTVMLNQRYNTKFITTDILNVRPVGFHDDESGIQKYMISVGSEYNGEAIFPAVNVTEEIELKIPVNSMIDGHRYYVTLKAVNRAGLEAADVTTEFIYDNSPPTGGNVVDGDGLFKKDFDFQTDTHHIKSEWESFDDIHSGIQYYSVGLGLRPFEDDVEPIIDVGLNTEITWNGSFVLGQVYYTVVEACNNARLCTKKSSNGIVLDNSPPIHGLVRVGSGSKHHTFIPRSSAVHIHWHGFEDPQSGIELFEACIGTKPGQCDVEPMFSCLLQSNILKTGLTLPASTSLYATVYAHNKVGMKVEQSSDAFIVDDSPPTVVSAPTFVLDYKIFQGFSVQWEPSMLSISWKFEDNESPIIYHTVTLKTHHEGHTPLERVQLGAENNLTLSLDGDNWLHSGDKYFVVVTSCNAAGHCSMAESLDLLIDSSPPHLGGFRPPLQWNTNTSENASDVTVTWYGFHDQESGIGTYFITISRSYSGNELTNGEISVVYNSTDGDQQTKIRLLEKIKRHDLLILSIWAQNHAGLNSSIARVSVYALSTSESSSTDEGVLELEKHSCDVHYCNKDCTCAVIGKPCISGRNIDNCTILNTTDVKLYNFATVEVFGGLESHPQKVTASSACLSGHWRLSDQIVHVSRFEWSMGLLNQPIGEGIFDLKNEIPWRDVGLRQEVAHCLTSNQSILHNNEYVVYVRAWYTIDQSAIFSSNSIKVDQTPPAVRRGKYIKDSNAACKLDFDFVDWMDTITVCWSNVFSEQQSELTHFAAFLGTSPKADDVLTYTNVGLKTNLTLTNLTLSHGTKYYFSITAYNSVGLHTCISSDGFVVDMDNPIAGVVFNTGHHVNSAYQSSNSSLSLSWHGFIDHYSGIRTYYAAIFEKERFDESKLAFYNVGLLNRYTFKAVPLKQGKTYSVVVKAVDASGHESEISFSQATTVDTTPPEGFECLAYRDIVSQTTLCSTEGSHGISTHVILDGTSFYQMVGTMTEIGTVDFTLGNLRVSVPVKVAHDGSSRFEYTFLPNDSIDSLLKMNGLCQANTTVSMMLNKCLKLTPSVDKAVIVQQIAPSVLQIRWMLLDIESHVKKISVGFGTTPGGFQIKALSQIHRDSNGLVQVDVPHGTRVYATVIAENHAGLRSIYHSKPITDDNTAPVFTNSPTITIEEVTNTTKSALISWIVADKETAIKQCYCGLGKQPSSGDLHSYVPSETTQTCRLDNLSLKHGDKVYARVLCTNGVELSSDISSRPVVVSVEPPSASNARITVVPSSDQNPKLMMTNQHVPVQSNLTCVQLQWSGFADVLGIERYEYRLKHGEMSVIDWTDTGKQTMASIDGLHLQTGSVYTAEVRAVSVGHYNTDVVQTDLLVLGNGPRLSGKPMRMSVTGTDMQLEWSEVFDLHRDAAVSYTLTVGTKMGYNDVIDDYHTTGTTFSFVIPRSTMVSPNINKLFIEFTCVYATGMTTAYRTIYKLK